MASASSVSLYFNRIYSSSVHSLQVLGWKKIAAVVSLVVAAIFCAVYYLHRRAFYQRGDGKLPKEPAQTASLRGRILGQPSSTSASNNKKISVPPFTHLKAVYFSQTGSSPINIIDEQSSHFLKTEGFFKFLQDLDRMGVAYVEVLTVSERIEGMIMDGFGVVQELFN